MDEPLSNLDAKLRVQTRTQIASLQQRLGVTTVYVTHDQTEAMTMGDRVAVLKDGYLQQCDTPQVLYDRPVNSFVAGFIGSPAMNLVEVQIDSQGASLGDAHVPLTADVLGDARSQGLSTVLLGFRPEDTEVGSEGFAMHVNLVESLGADGYIYGDIQDAHGASYQVTIRTDGRKIPKRGENVRLHVTGGHVHAFNPQTGLRLGQ
jgi:multiple sugar transport system ATP-binding protein